MIRLATPKDYDSILKIWLATNMTTHFYIPKSFWKQQAQKVKKLFNEADIYLYEDNKLIKGFIGIMFYNYIAGIFVDDSYTHTGIGSALLKKAQESYNELELHVYKKNERAIYFYQKNKFKIISEGVNVETNEPEYFMKWQKSSIG